MVLNHLEIEYDVRPVDLQDKDEEFLALSPTGKVPLLQGEDFVLYESTIINDYLADAHGWDDAYPGDAVQQARQRLGMKQFDDVFLPAYQSVLYGDASEPEDEDPLRRELESLNDTVEDLEGHTQNMLGFHLVPFWAQMVWLGSGTIYFLELIRNYDPLGDWIDEVFAEPVVRESLPDREDFMELVESRR